MRTLFFSVVSAIIILSSGCGKKDQPAAEATDAPSAAEPAPAEPPPAAAAAAQQQPPPALQDIDSALQAKQYDQAATALINLEKAIQSRRLPPEQAGQAAFQMRQLQLQLQSAASTGDPNALAAMRKLAAARHQ
jgi:hypothetical protein